MKKTINEIKTEKERLKKELKLLQEEYICLRRRVDDLKDEMGKIRLKADPFHVVQKIAEEKAMERCFRRSNSYR